MIMLKMNLNNFKYFEHEDKYISCLLRWDFFFYFYIVWKKKKINLIWNNYNKKLHMHVYH